MVTGPAAQDRDKEVIKFKCAQFQTNNYFETKGWRRKSVFNVYIVR